ARADIYSWGVLAYEMLTGATPFTGRPPQAMLAAQVTETPESITKRRSNIPAPLAALVMRCLEKRASDRPQRAQELVQVLDSIATPSGGTAPTSPPNARRRAWPLVTAAVVAIVVIGVLVATLGNRAWSKGAGATVAGPMATQSVAVLPFVNV